VRSAALSAARLVLLAGPTVLAFFAGGYFDEPRAWAGLAAWILVAVGLLAQPRPMPRTRVAWLALGGLGLLAAWTLLSILWAPIAGNAYHAGQIAVLYVGGLAAATLLLRGRGAQRAVEPALAAGALIVIGYGISERLLPGLLSFARSLSAQGRLEQPLTYWNAMGEVAALGFVLSARIAGDATRAAGVRIAAAAACAPLGLGLYLSFSRGALFACAAGLVTLLVAAGRREALWALLLAILAGALASLASAPLRGVTALAGSSSTRESQGAIALVALVVVMLAAAAAQGRLIARGRPGPLRLPRRAPLIATAVICAGLALAIVVGAKESSAASQPLSGGAARYVTLQSNRYAYWRVALRAFAQQPLHGVGAGGWSVYWVRWRRFDEFAQDAHSLPLQTLAELGVIGVALLAAFLAAIALAGRDALRTAPELAVGPMAGFVVWAAHAPLDWDWQMPAVTLIAIVLAGALLALGDQSASAIRGASRLKIQTANTQTPT
jgi:O-Antigen ligase